MITLQTTNALLIIRCFTKYIIEIENETALLDQLNAKSSSSSATESLPPSNEEQSESLNKSDCKKQLNDMSSSSSNASPRRLNRNRFNYQNKANFEDSQEEPNENDSEIDSIAVNNFSNQFKENETLSTLITNLF